MRRLLVLGGLIGVIAAAGVALAQQGQPPLVPQGPAPPVPPVQPGQVPPPAPAQQFPGVQMTAQPAPTAAAAESRKLVMAVKVQAVEVRSGPAEGFPPTGELRYGQPVVVLRESAKNKGWVEIEPPHDSFSWISTRFLKKIGERSGIVDTDANVLAGSNLPNQQVHEPNVESAKAQRGTLVTILGREIQSGKGNGGLLPIQPLLDEVRYLPASALAPVSEIQLASAQVGSQGGFQGTPAYTGPGQTVQVVEADRLLEQARVLLERAANDPTLDAGQREQARNRLIAMRQQGTSQPLGQAQPAYPQGQLVSGQQKPQQPAAVQGQQSMYNNTQQAVPQWTKWGILRSTAFQKDGQPTYVLVDEKGSAIVYAVSSQIQPLAPYVGRMVTMYGPINAGILSAVWQVEVAR